MEDLGSYPLNFTTDAKSPASISVPYTRNVREYYLKYFCIHGRYRVRVEIPLPGFRKLEGVIWDTERVRRIKPSILVNSTNETCIV